MDPKSSKNNLKEQIDSFQSTASVTTGSSLGSENEFDRARSYTVTTENYPGTVQDSMISFASSSKSSKGKDYDAQTAVETATEKQRKTIGLFQVEPLFGHDKLELTVTHLPMSTSGVIRMPGEQEVANCYWNIYEKNGSCSVHTGAAQGVNEEFDVAENKYKKTKQHDYVEDQLLSHLAAALLGHMVQHEYNHDPSFSLKPESLKFLSLEGYEAPTLLQISNYMTDLRLVQYEDAAQVAPRKQYIENLIKNINKANGKHGFNLLRFIGLTKDNTHQEQAESAALIADFQDKLTARLINIAQQRGLAPQDGSDVMKQVASSTVGSILKPGRLLFNRQGLNAFRIFAAWTDSAELRQHAAERVVKLTASLKSQQDPMMREMTQLEIERIKSTSNQLLITELRYSATQIVSILLIVPVLASLVLNRRFGALSNIPLHKEALKLNLVSLINGTSVGGCQSAKDRFGSLLCFTRPQEDYIAKYGSAPPAYGLIGFIPGVINVVSTVAGSALRVGVNLALSATINAISLFYTHSPERYRPEAGAVTSYSFLTNIATMLQRGVAFLHDYQQIRRAREAAGIEPAGLFKDYGPDRQDFLKERVAEHWISGAMQYVADANAAGALGIKNNSQIIPAAYREAINQKIEERIQMHYENIARLIQANPEQANTLLKESYDLQQIQYLMKCFPVISEQLANINEAVKKDGVKAAKANQKIQDKCSAYLEPVLKEIFKISDQSRLEELPPKEQILRSQLQGHILALATISYPQPQSAGPDIAPVALASRVDTGNPHVELEREAQVAGPQIAVGEVLSPKTVLTDPAPGIFTGSKRTAKSDKAAVPKNQGTTL